MSISDQITRLNNAKAAIKQAISNKGVTVSDEAKLDEYPALIDSIEVGSGSGESYENPDFYEIRTSGGTDYRGLFYYYPGTTLDLSNFDTSNVTSMQYMFRDCSNLTSLDVSNFDTSKVTVMTNMFNGCNNLTSINVSNFDTSNVTDMQYMFNACYNLTSLDLSSFDTSNVTNMTYMFGYCTKLTSINVSSFNTSNVTNMNYMFYNCTKLTSITRELDGSKLTNGFFPGNYSHPFKGCTSLETLYLKNIYKNCTMTNASKWSINLGETKVKDECLLYIINELPDLINDKGLTATSSIVFTLPKTNTLTQEQVQVAIDKGWTVANTNYS